MTRIFISAGHCSEYPGTKVGDSVEVEETRKTRDLILEHLENRKQEFKDPQVTVKSVPDGVDLASSIWWINDSSSPNDITIEIHTNAYSADHSVRGAETFYIAGNDQRREDAKLLLNSLVESVREIDPEFEIRAAKPDSESQYDSLGFCRNIAIPSVLVELCFLTNPKDRDLLQNHRDKFAKGIVDGLVKWLNQSPPQLEEYAEIGIQINERIYEERGILVNQNSYIPVDLVERLGINKDLIKSSIKREVGNIVYVKAVELQRFNISIDWDGESRTVILKPKQRVSDKIMSPGQTSEDRLKEFIQKHNEDIFQEFLNLPKLYTEQAEAEGVNYDIAFCQMCLETNYLKFTGDVGAEQNNFCGLGAVGGGAEGACFPDPETGVKAQIQHLKAYASTQPVNNTPIVDPRFHYVDRGVADTVHSLSGRWAVDPNYGKKIMKIMRRLHGVI